MEVFTYAVENIGQIADAGVTLVLAVVLLVFFYRPDQGRRREGEESLRRRTGKD